VIGVLLKKLLRDVWLGLVIVAVLLLAFQVLWARVTRTVTQDLLGELKNAGVAPELVLEIFFKNAGGQIVQRVIGASGLDITQPFNLLSSGYLHPLVQTILCIWAIGRASGAIAGEIDRGTMELLLAQPIRRSRVILAHGVVDLITIPVLCLSMWAGTWLGTWIMGFLTDPDPLLRAEPWRFGPSLLNVAVLIFAVSGYTMWISAAGRFRGRVLGLAVIITLVQFLINVIGQLWEPADYLRPLTVFYYYQPQPMILNEQWACDLAVWGRLAVLFLVGLIGYLLAWWTFCKRDLPAPL
jgi:ABC-2 type transport system permease protein